MSVEAATMNRSSEGTSTIATGLTPERRQARERARRRTRVGKRVILAVFGAAALIGAVAALRPRPVPVDIVAATRGPMTVVVSETGKTRVKDRFVVSAPTAGTVARSTLQAGAAVSVGDVIARVGPVQAGPLDPRTRAEAQAALAAALAAERQARAAATSAAVAAELAARQAERAARLGNGGAIAPAAVETAEFEARARAEQAAAAALGAGVARQEARRARALLDGDRLPARVQRQVSVRAPATGRVLRLFQESEAVVQPGAPLVEIGDPASLEVVVDVLSEDATQIHAGDEARLEIGAGQRPLAARVARVEPSGFTRLSALGVEEQRVNVILTITDVAERWSTLGDGFRVNARIVVWQRPDVLRVPGSAVFRHGEGWAVFVVQDGRAEVRAVVPGRRSETEVEIVSGLVPGTPIVLYPGDQLASGKRVKRRPPV